MSRARRIVQLLVDNPRPHSLDLIIAGLGIDDRDRNARKVVAAQLVQLRTAGKVHRRGRTRHHTYTATPDALRDRRLKPASPPSATRKRRKADAKPAPPQRPAPTPAAPPRTANPAPIARAFTFGATTGTAHKDGLRKRIAADLRTFTATGGRIQRLARGESGELTPRNMHERNSPHARQQRRAETETDQ